MLNSLSLIWFGQPFWILMWITRSSFIPRLWFSVPGSAFLTLLLAIDVPMDQATANHIMAYASLTTANKRMKILGKIYLLTTVASQLLQGLTWLETTLEV